MRGKGSANRCGFAKMLAFHGHTAASVADEFHGRQFAFAHMGVIDLRSAAERAILFIAAGTAKMTGLLGHRTAGFTGISHIRSPLWGAVNRHTVYLAQAVPETGLVTFAAADDRMFTVIIIAL